MFSKTLKHFVILLVVSLSIIPNFTSADTVHTDLKTWSSDPSWVYSKTDPFLADGSETVVVITDGDGWFIGSYAVTSRVSNFDNGDGLNNMLRLDRYASPVPATGGTGYTTDTSPATITIIFDGNSLTQGSGSTAGQTYPNQFLSLLGDISYKVSNLGVSGQSTVSMSGDAATQIDPLYNAATANTLVVWEVTNDLFSGTSAATAYSNLVSYAEARQAAGWRVIILNVLPRSEGGVPVDFESSRETVNSTLRSDFNVATANSRVFLPASGITYADILVDVAANSAIGDFGDELDTTYYDPDHVHMNNTGYGVVATDAVAGYQILSNILDDSTDPTVSLTAPSNGTTVSGSAVTVSANASDNNTVEGVKFYYDDTNLIGSEDTSSPYSLTWDSASVPDGSHTLFAVARDQVGNAATSSSVTVTVSNTVSTPVSSSRSGRPAPPSPTAPIGGFTARAGTIDAQGKTVLHFGFGNDVTNIAISENVYFYPSTNIQATTSALWTATTTKMLYVRYCNEYGRCSDPFSLQINAYAPIIPSSYKFYKNLSYRMTNDEVRELQKYLNANDFVIAQSGAGSPGKETDYFGLLTYKALIKFQEAHAIDILTPHGLKEGTGYFGPSTRAFVNK